jgi:hypothetical protein
VGSELEEAVALDAGLEDEAEVAVLEVADAAVDEAGGAAGGAAGEVLALDEGDAQAAQGGISGDATAGDAAADDEDIEVLRGEGEQPLGARSGGLGRRRSEDGERTGVAAGRVRGGGLGGGLRTHGRSVMARRGGGRENETRRVKRKTEEPGRWGK